MRLDTGKRVDTIAHSAHDARAESDYRLLRACGMRTARDALRWHLIETAPGIYDWSSFRPMLRAADRAGVEVIWDLCHFGLPDHIDAWAADTPERFAAFAAAAARVFRSETDAAPSWCPVNEMSYWAFAGGTRGHIHPLDRWRGAEWKRQLARMAVSAARAVREIDPRARLVHPDPVIHITAETPSQRDDAERHRALMFESWDMVGGRRDHDLGGGPDCLDTVGVNFYANNQWFHHGRTIERGEPAYRPFRAILAEVWARYGRPILVTETGAEAWRGPPWLRAIAVEIRAAMDAGIPVVGCCLYPVMDYPGWTDDRHCRCGPIAIDAGWTERRLDPAMLEALAEARAIVGGDGGNVARQMEPGWKQSA